MFSKISYILFEQRWKILLLFVFSGLSSLLALVGIGLLFPFIELIQKPQSVQENFILQGLAEVSGLGTGDPLKIVLLLGELLIGAFIVKSVAHFFIQYYTNRLMLDVQKSLRRKLFDFYLKAPYSFHLGRNSMTLINSVFGDVLGFTLNVVSNLFVTINETLLLLAILIFAVSLNPSLMAGVAVLAVLMLLFGHFTKTKTYAYGKIGTDSNAETLKILRQGIATLVLNRLAGSAGYFLESFTRETERNQNATSKYYTFLLLPRISFELLFFCAFVGFLTLYVMGGGDATTIISMAGTLAVAMIQIIPAMTRLTNGFSGIRNGMPVMEKIYADLKALEINGKEPEYKGEPLKLQELVEISDLSFSYGKGGRKALDQVSFSFRKGDSVGLIGQSGSGKSTLANILLGLIQPTSGEVRIDGMPLSQNAQAWQRNIGYVPQMIVLLDDTLEANIAFGIPKDKIDRVKVDRLLEAVHLRKLRDELPDGVKTNIGENGIRLSGGQRQRIGIARALYRDPEILVFDEATSALDTETEEAVTQAITELQGEKTMIIIAHRISTLKGCNKIFELQEGRLIRTATYGEISGMQP